LYTNGFSSVNNKKKFFADTAWWLSKTNTRACASKNVIVGGIKLLSKRMMNFSISFFPPSILSSRRRKYENIILSSSTFFPSFKSYTHAVRPSACCLCSYVESHARITHFGHKIFTFKTRFWLNSFLRVIAATTEKMFNFALFPADKRDRDFIYSLFLQQSIKLQ